MSSFLLKRFNTLTEKQKTPLALGIFAVFILIFYGNTLANGFVGDDFGHIVENHSVKSLSHIPNAFLSCMSGATGEDCHGQFHYYRPLTALSSIATHQISSQAWAFHATNLFYLFFVAALLFIVIRVLTQNYWVSFLASVFFIVHPINNEVANYASLSPDLLLAFFSLSSLFFYIRYRKQDNKIQYFILSAAFYFVALLAKEVAVVLPVLFLTFDVAVRNISPRQFMRKHELVRYLAFPGLFFAYIMVRNTVVGGGVPDLGLTLPERVFAAVVLLQQAIVKLFIPVPLSIAHTFEYTPSFLSPVFLVSLGVVFGYLGLAVFFWRMKHRLLFFWSIWLIILFLPAALFVGGRENYFFAERYLFLPSMAFSFMLAWALVRVAARLRQRGVAVTAGLLLVVMVVSWIIVFPRNEMWESNQTLFQATLEQNENAHNIRRDLAFIYFRNEDLASARHHLSYLIQNAPNWRDISMAYKGMGDIARIEGDMEQALGYYLSATQTATMSPRDWVPFNDAGLAYLQQDEPLLAFTYFCQSVGLFPNEQNQQNFNAALSRVDEELIQTDRLEEEIREQFTPFPEGHVRFAGGQCDSPSCQWAIAFNPATLQVIAPPLITVHTANGTPVEITNSGFDPERATAILETDAQYEDEKLTFLFPTCSREYYSAVAE